MSGPYDIVTVTPDVAGHLDEQDRVMLSEIIADGFFDLAASQWLIPDPVHRRSVYATFFRWAYVEPALRYGHIDYTTDWKAAAVWLHLPTGDQTFSASREDPEFDAEVDTRLRAALGDMYPRFDVFGGLLDEQHLKAPHHFLGVIAARPGQQRRGRGGALLTHHQQRLDAEEAVGYLEAADPALVPLYEGHGWMETGNQVTLNPYPGSGMAVPVVMPTMVRLPANVAMLPDLGQ